MQRRTVRTYQTFFSFLKQHHCRKYIVISVNQSNGDLCKNFIVVGFVWCVGWLVSWFLLRDVGVKQVNGFVMYIKRARTQTDLLHAPVQTAAVQTAANSSSNCRVEFFQCFCHILDFGWHVSLKLMENY